MGLPGSGKTSLAKEVAGLVGNCVLWNADEVRENLGNPGFSPEARLAQARRMRFLCDTVTAGACRAVADFVCPTPETRDAFRVSSAFVVWVDRIASGRFEDTNRMFVPPEEFDVRVVDDGRTPFEWAMVAWGAWIDRVNGVPARRAA